MVLATREDPVAGNDDWADEYENILEFYFWEPQHLNRVSPPKDKRRPPAEVLGALMKREVPLNHQLNIFFRLAPKGLVERWLRATLTGTAAAQPALISLRGDPIMGATQPDLYFQCIGSRVFVELKVEAKSGLEQLCKYALLSAYLDRQGEQPAAVIFMGRGDAPFAKLREAHSSREDQTFLLPEKVLAHARRLNVDADAVLRKVRALEVVTSDYGNFDQALTGELAGLSTTTDAEETLANLIRGMRRFLEPLTVAAAGVRAPAK